MNYFKILIAIALNCLALSCLAAETQDLWRFKVMVGERQIGTHDFRLVSRPGEQELSSQASFNVKLLFVNVFDYDHESAERWRANCLQSIESKTLANRKRFAVTGKTTDQGFVVSNSSGTVEMPPCVQTFAYWNPAILESRRLLNAQTGELEEVDISYTGQTNFDVGGDSYTAEQYRITLQAGHIDLWYHTDSNTWLGLETLSPDNRLVRYIPETTPLTRQNSSSS
ncbi:MAG: DUF6134 family protein [Pseudomonadota bacterium]